MPPIKQPLVDKSLEILEILGLPRAQQNERSALTLLALLNLSPGKEWNQSEDPLIGISPIMDWIRNYYELDYAANTRESVRKNTIHQFVEAGIVICNPDKPGRSTNSPLTVYQISPMTFNLLRSYGSADWDANLAYYQSIVEELVIRYAKVRKQQQVPIKLLDGKTIELSPGSHSELIKEIIEQFGSRFAPGGNLVYAGDTGSKWGYFDDVLAEMIGIDVDRHGKMPDVIIFWRERNWLFLVEAVTSTGPVDHKRKDELIRLFATKSASIGLVFVSAFPDRSTMTRFLGDIAWETEVWISSDPSHMIHFNGDKFIGPM